MIGFWIARLRGDDAKLAMYSRAPQEVIDSVAGKHIAIVGNARSLSETSFGSQIDGADIVVRINGAPIADVASHGSRTDWIGMSTPTPAAMIKERAPKLLMWMSPKRKRLPYALATDTRFFLYPRTDWNQLHSVLGTRPTTGMMLIDFALRTKASKITLFGFDFFASLSLSGNRSAADVPHDFDAERNHVEALMAQDPRLTLKR